MSIVQTPVRIIGGTSGTSFRVELARSGALLNRIAVWAGPSELLGIRVWFTNSSTPHTFGTINSGSHQEFEFLPGERITSLSLWGNGVGTRSGGIRFRTSLDRRFFHHMTRWSLRQEFAIDVASGLCEGIRGRHGTDIHALGFTFLLPITQARMTNVRYPTLGLETAGIRPASIREFDDSNLSHTSTKQWTNGGSYTTTKSSSWSLTTGIEAHYTVTVSAGIPVIAPITVESGWVLSSSSTHTTSTEESETFEWSRSGECGPRQWVSFIISTRRGDISLPYNATMEITLTTGARFTYPIAGLYLGVNFSTIESRLETGDLDDTGREDVSTDTTATARAGSSSRSEDRISTSKARDAIAADSRAGNANLPAARSDGDAVVEVHLEYD